MLLVVMACSVGLVLHTVEFPVEKAILAEEAAVAHRLKISLFHSIFDFVVSRNIMDRLVMTEDQIKYATCLDLFGPMAKAHAAFRFPDEELGPYNRIVVDFDETPLFFDMSRGLISDKCEQVSEFIDDLWVMQDPKYPIASLLSDKGCYMACPLVLPTVQQVEACRINKTSSFDEECLNNKETCPNCDRLNTQVPFDQLDFNNPRLRAYAEHAGTLAAPIHSLYYVHYSYTPKHTPPWPGFCSLAAPDR
jgi:hypothetical protein